MIVTGCGLDLEEDGIAYIYADVSSKTLDVAIARITDVPSRISGQGILAGYRIAALSLGEAHRRQRSEQRQQDNAGNEFV